MRRADEAGLRPGWRGAVAYAASPWLWRDGAFRAFTFVTTALAVVWIATAIARADMVAGKVVSGLVAAGLCSLLLLGPTIRAARRRAEAPPGLTANVSEAATRGTPPPC